MSQDFEKRTREILEESTARLDGRTLSRLTQARHAALAAHEKPRTMFGRGWLRSYMPAGAAAVAVLAVVMWVQRPGDAVGPTTGPVDDMELLADGDAPDFVNDNDDPEFYEWAAGEVET